MVWLSCVLHPRKQRSVQHCFTFLLAALMMFCTLRGTAQSPTPVSVAGPLTLVAPGKISTLAKGSCFYLISCGNDGPFSQAKFTNPYAIAFDNSGNLYIVDSYASEIRIVKNTGGNLADRTIKNFLGTERTNCPSPTYACGDGGPAGNALFENPTGIAFNSAGDIFIADWNNYRVRRVDHQTGYISTYAGNGRAFPSASANDVPATQASVEPYRIAVGPDGTLYIAGLRDDIVQAVDPTTQHIRTYAGNGMDGPCTSNCEGVPATQIALGTPTAMAVAQNGDLYYVSAGVVQKIEKATGLITTVVGDSSSELYPTNGQQAKSTNFFGLSDIAVLSSGDLLLADDSFPSQIYRIEMSTGRLYVVAGCSDLPPGSHICTNANPTFTRQAFYSLAIDNLGNIVFTNGSADGDQDSTNPPTLLLIQNTPGTVYFNHTAVGVLSSDSPETPLLMNIGTQPATLSSDAVATTSAGAANSFTLATSSPVSDGITPLCSPGALAAGSTCGFDLGFLPAAPGAITGTLTVKYSGNNLSGTEQVFPLNGTTLSVSAAVSSVQVAAGAGSTTLTASVTYSGLAPTGTATFTVNGGSVITATCSGTTSPLTCTATYDPSSLAPGSYTIAFDVKPDSNYTSDITATGTLTVTATSATVTLGSLTATYDGNPHGVTVTTNPSGLSTNVTYNGSTTAPTAAGSYTVVATITTSGYAGSATGTLVITKASATVTLGSLAATYDGNPHSVTVSTVPAGLATTVTYNGSTAIPSAVGSYAVVATVTDANYTGSSSGTLVISNQSTPSLLFSISSHIFGDADFAVAATSNSQGVITYSIVSGPATISGNLVHLTGAGAVSVRATQAAFGSYQATTQSAMFTVAKATPILNWSTPAPVMYGSTLGAAQLNATATGVGNAALSGNFVYTPASGSVVNRAPSETLQVVFTPSDNADYNASNASVVLSVTQATLNISANNATRAYGTANPAFTGSITGRQNGDSFTETFSTVATVNSNAGSYAIVPAAQGANLGSYVQSVHAGTLTVTRAGVDVRSALSSASPSAGQNVTLTATVVSQTSGTPSGSVQFVDNGTVLGTATLTGNTAVLATNFTRTGAHTISVVYSGDVNFMSATVPTLNLNVIGQDFSLTVVSNNSDELHVGETAAYKLRVAPATSGQTFSSDVHFSFTADMPFYATGQFSPSTVPSGSGSTDVTFSFVTSKLSQREDLKRGTIALAALLPLCGLRRRKTLRGMRLAAVLLTFAFLMGMTGCGSGYAGNIFPVTISAESGGITHSVTVRAIVLKTNQ